jgi:signal transduction histidine kinase
MHQPPIVLMIDDEPVARESIEALLMREGYDIQFAEEGKAGINKAIELLPDLILLDVMMPEMDGYEVCGILKSDERINHIPIIMLTSLNDKESLARGLDAGADEFLSKPVGGLELRARVRSMLRIKRQHDELLETLKLREDMANMIVHDIRNPLTVIQGYSELMLYDKTLSPDSLRCAEYINRFAKRLQSFTNDLLMLAKMEHGSLILNRISVDVDTLLLEVKESHEIIAKSKNITLIVNSELTTPVKILVDANLFRRVLDNLVSNAIKFSPTDTAITMSVEHPADKAIVLIKVADQGTGISEGDRKRVFEKFEVINLSQKDIKQIGLGLAFCKLVTDAHGGTISIESNFPKGAIFVIQIQVAEPV